jgi:hypothetical protein
VWRFGARADRWAFGGGDAAMPALARPARRPGSEVSPTAHGCLRLRSGCRGEARHRTLPGCSCGSRRCCPVGGWQGEDARSTWRYLLSEQRLDEVMAANWPASAKTVEAMTRQAAMECAGVLTGAPQGAELKEFVQELAFAPVAVVMTRRDQRAIRAMGRAIRLLHWRDRRLDREVARQLAEDETPKPVPHVCRDAEAWRGSGYTRLARATTTFVAATRRTPPNPASGKPYVLDVPPPAVRRAGGGALREFKEGRAAVAASGCLACHRIGEKGNRGPGPPLTRIGSELTEREIRRALIDPRAPMPSFRGLPPENLHVMIRFLSLLR